MPAETLAEMIPVLESAWLLAATGAHDLWYAVPLIVAVSLVYAATRHERLPEIFYRAARVASSIVIFMGAILVALVFISKRL